MMPLRRVLLTPLVLAAAGFISPAHAIEISGKVTDQGGAPVYGVMIKVASSSAAAEVTKVFSDRAGNYRVRDLGDNVHVNSVQLSTFKLGYEQRSPTSQVLPQLVDKVEDGQVTVDFVMAPIQNVAHQVPASAWWALTPDSPEKVRTITNCTQCHQMPNEASIRFATNVGSADEAAREQAWRAMTQFMRVQAYGVLQSEHQPDANAELMAMMADPEHSFFNQLDEDILAPWFAKHMPTSFDHYDVADIDKFAGELEVTANTVIREYPWDDLSFVRETAVVDGQFWVVDINRNRLGRLEPDSGAYIWYDLPLLGASAPHTLVPDRNGNLWVTLLAGSGAGAAMFNPKTEQWKTYDGFPVGAMGHDFSIGADYMVDFDPAGMNWMTMISHNQLAGFHRDTGEVEVYDLPMPKTETNPGHVAVYGGALSADGNVWFAQVFGYLGRFNTTTKEVDHLVDFPPGTSPHRIAIGDDDILYVSLLGTAEILLYDTVNLKEIKRVKLPDAASSLYAVTWDPVRKVVWSGVCNNDSIFKYDPATDKITEIPLQMKDLHIRMIAVNRDNGDLLIANSPLPPGDHEMRRVFLLHPGDLPEKEQVSLR